MIFRSESGRPWHPAEAALWLALYGLVVTWLTWPLLPNAASHLPVPNSFNPFDSPRLAWSLAWQSHHALALDPAAWLGGNIYHPAPHALLYGPLGLGLLPYFLPTFPFSSRR